MTTTIELKKNYPPPTENSSRGIKNVHYFGTWRKSMKRPQVIRETNEHARVWMECNQELFKILDMYMKREFPAMYSKYLDSKLPIGVERMFPPFNCCAINFGLSKEAHYDKSDPHFGHCVVIPFGTYTGGEVDLEECDAEVDVQPGDLISFVASDILHKNMPLQSGQRWSLTFFNYQSATQSTTPIRQTHTPNTTRLPQRTPLKSIKIDLQIDYRLLLSATISYVHNKKQTFINETLFVPYRCRCNYTFIYQFIYPTSM
ncbi:hypothetical protein AKO1_002237 [Acrasis kona]|uniref:Fe2OG dioxygenase domain-containing protein n=1 Tax=Acrasis kona TaxID=1008807 RepID=A0AAW2ZCZ4_9EUKA